MDFNTAFQRLLGHEGVLSLDPKDRGNWTGGVVGVGIIKGTKYGISAAQYPKVDIKNLTEAKAKAIYLADFWEPVQGDKLYDGVAWQAFDFTVNSGAGNAIRGLQRALGVAPDGHFGEVSREAARTMSETDQIMRYVAERLDFIAAYKGFNDNGRGLVHRMANNLRYGAVDS